MLRMLCEHTSSLLDVVCNSQHCVITWLLNVANGDGVLVRVRVLRVCVTMIVRVLGRVCVVVLVLAMVLCECVFVIARGVGTVRVIVRVGDLVVSVIVGVCAIVIVRARVLDRVLAPLRDRVLARKECSCP